LAKVSRNGAEASRALSRRAERSHRGRCGFSLKLGWPDDAQQRYYRAHNEVEQIAFGKDGTEELQKAVTNERATEKDLFVVRNLGRRMIWLAAGFSGTAFVLSLLALQKQEPIQTSVPMRGDGT
jgi:hypothetical protein